MRASKYARPPLLNIGNALTDVKAYRRVIRRCQLLLFINVDISLVTPVPNVLDMLRCS